MTYDSAAWGALAVALSVLLGVVAFFRWRNRGLAAGLRGAAWTLVPVSAWLTGVLEMGFEVAEAVGDWAVHLVFSPVVWFGIVLAGIAAALFGVSSVLAGRGQAPARRTGGEPRTPPAVGARGAADDDLGDIEAILRRHGIS